MTASTASSSDSQNLQTTGPWLVVGLGNPGSKYQNTRHNMGFMAIDALAHRYGCHLSDDKQSKSLMGSIRLNNYPHKIILVKPLTYMNLSGQTVTSLSQYYKVPPQQILVIVDDAALPLGRLRIRNQGSHGGQNGLRNIIQCLGNRQDFPRLRLGIGQPHPNQPLEKYVLQAFSNQELSTVSQVLDASMDATEHLIHHGITSAMSAFNGLTIKTS